MDGIQKRPAPPAAWSRRIIVATAVVVAVGANIGALKWVQQRRSALAASATLDTGKLTVADSATAPSPSSTLISRRDPPHRDDSDCTATQGDDLVVHEVRTDKRWLYLLSEYVPETQDETNSPEAVPT